MVRWRVKGCPRCGGDMYLEIEVGGWSWDCLLCGFREEIDRSEFYEKVPVKRKKGDLKSFNN